MITREQVHKLVASIDVVDGSARADLFRSGLLSAGASEREADKIIKDMDSYQARVKLVVAAASTPSITRRLGVRRPAVKKSKKRR